MEAVLARLTMGGNEISEAAKTIGSLMISTVVIAYVASQIIRAVDPLLTSGPFYGVYMTLKSIAALGIDNSLTILVVAVVAVLSVLGRRERF